MYSFSCITSHFLTVTLETVSFPMHVTSFSSIKTPELKVPALKLKSTSRARLVSLQAVNFLAINNHDVRP